MRPKCLCRWGGMLNHAIFDPHLKLLKLSCGQFSFNRHAVDCWLKIMGSSCGWSWLALRMICSFLRSSRRTKTDFLGSWRDLLLSPVDLRLIAGMHAACHCLLFLSSSFYLFIIFWVAKNPRFFAESPIDMSMPKTPFLLKTPVFGLSFMKL